MLHYRIDKDKTGKLSIPDGKKFDTLWQVRALRGGRGEAHLGPGGAPVSPQVPGCPAGDVRSRAPESLGPQRSPRGLCLEANRRPCLGDWEHFSLYKVSGARSLLQKSLEIKETQQGDRRSLHGSGFFSSGLKRDGSPPNCW